MGPASRRATAEVTPRDRLIRLIARVPASVHAKLVAAFLAIVVLLMTVGAARP